VPQAGTPTGTIGDMANRRGPSAVNLDELLDAAAHEQGMAAIAYANAQAHWDHRLELIRQARDAGASVDDIADAVGLSERYVATLLRR
jgi:AraC-like DNA-binding protein